MLVTTPRDYGEQMNHELVTKSQFKARALEYFRKVEMSGASIVITDRGQPAVEIRRCRADKRFPLEILRGSVVELKDPMEPVAPASSRHARLCGNDEKNQTP